MTTTNFGIFKRKINAAIKKHLAAGGCLIYGSFGYSINQCPIGCLIGEVELEGKSIHQLVCETIGVAITRKNMWDFISGFDADVGDPIDPYYYNNQYFILGRQLRKKHLS